MTASEYLAIRSRSLFSPYRNVLQSLLLFQLSVPIRLRPLSTTTSVPLLADVSIIHLSTFTYRIFSLFNRPLLQSFVLWFIARCSFGKYALHGIIRTQHYTAKPTDVDVFQYVHDNVDDVQRRLDAAIRIHRCVKWYATMDFGFQRTTPDGEVQHTTARFRTKPDVITDISCVTTEGIANEFFMGIENFNRRGSNWVVESVLDFRITYAPYRPAQGTSFIPTPPEIAAKKAIVNVQNLTDDRCFIYSVSAALHPVDTSMRPCRTCHYRPYLDELNIDGLKFPLPVKDVSKFESQNVDIAVSVVTYEERELIPLYISPHRDRKHTVHLLLL